MSLRFPDGRSSAVAQSGPGFVILSEPTMFAMTEGEALVLAISVDGDLRETRMRIAAPVKVGGAEVLVK
jgi:hypothetical protein